MSSKISKKDYEKMKTKLEQQRHRLDQMKKSLLPKLIGRRDIQKKLATVYTLIGRLHSIKEVDQQSIDVLKRIAEDYEAMKK